MSSVARPADRSTTSTLRMSAPTCPSAVATAPSAPGRSGSITRKQIRHSRHCHESYCRQVNVAFRTATGNSGVAGDAGRLDFQAVPDHTVDSSTTRISRAEVAHLARLARLAVTEQELDVFAGQLDVILGSVARVGEVAAADIEPTTHAVPLRNVLRPDEVGPCLDRSIVLAQAPAVEDNRFRVPRILDDEQ